MSKIQQASSKSIWIFLLLNLVATVALATLHFIDRKRGRIVYVDVVRAISTYKGTASARQNLKQKNDLLKSNLDTLKQELEIAQSNFEKSKKSGTTKAQLMFENILTGKQRQYLEYQHTVNDQGQKQQQEISMQILGEINEYVKHYGEEKGYDYIMVVTNAGQIAYGNKKLDVTTEVIKGLNDNYIPKRSTP